MQIGTGLSFVLFILGFMKSSSLEWPSPRVLCQTKLYAETDCLIVSPKLRLNRLYISSVMVTLCFIISELFRARKLVLILYICGGGKSYKRTAFLINQLKNAIVKWSVMQRKFAALILLVFVHTDNRVKRYIQNIYVMRSGKTCHIIQKKKIVWNCYVFLLFLINFNNL